MGASRHIGRVGALAVALGAGVVLNLAAAGTAVADSGTSPVSATDSSHTRPAPGRSAAARGTLAERGGDPAAARGRASRAATPSPATALPRAARQAGAASRTAPGALVAARTARPAAATPPAAQFSAPRADTRAAAASGGLPVAAAAPSAGSSTSTPPAGSGPGSFIESVLAAVRREFFNSAPTLSPVIYGQTTSATGQAVVTGSFGAADADGDPLTYTYIGTPQNGGSLQVDQATGAFTYTAPATMNELGGFDQFNVVVSDQTPGGPPTFHGIGDLVSRIPVLGPLLIGTAQLLGLATPYSGGSVPARVAVSVSPTEPAPPLTGDAQTLSTQPIAAADGWTRYVLAPKGCVTGTTCTVRPVSLFYKNDGVTVGPNGEITLNYRLGGQAPVVILDYGQDVGGYTRYSFGSGTPNIVSTSYSESIGSISPIGDGALSTALLANSGSPWTFDLTPVLFGGGEWQGPLQGGYRYQQITLAAPGSVTINDVSTQMTAPIRSADGYAGNFLSNSDPLNRIWYAGAYTVNLDEISAGTPGAAGPYPLSILGEAAKRDRAIWAGDLLTAMGTLHNVFGANGDLLARNNIQIMADNPVRDFILFFISLPFPVPGNPDKPGPAPGVCSGVAKGGCSFWGAGYSMNLAQNMANYYRLTGDTSFVAQNWAAVTRSVEWANSLINPRTGLVDVPPGASLDWSVVNRAVGQVASTNMLQYNSLTSAAALAEAIGDTAAAQQYSAQAAALKQAINDNLWNPALGAYDSSTDARGYVVQDANVWAVLYGVADAAQSAQIVQTLAGALATPYGLRAAEASVRGYPNIVSPFIGGFGLAANYLAGRPDLALQQMLTTWGYMADSDAGSTTWERINLPDGNLAGTPQYLFGDSASHAWSTGATAALSDYVLGVTPTAPAYQTWQVKPFPQGLAWAQGRVPTASGPVGVRWQLGETAFRMTVDAPAGTTGTVNVPILGAPRSIYMDGVQVWDGSAALNGAAATATGDGYIAFSGVTGTHTWAWS